MEGQRPTDEAKKLFDIAIQVITQARLENAMDEFSKKLAWGMRAWIMGEIELANSIRATYILLEKVNQKLDRIAPPTRRL
jgi:hypothetical protein